VKWVYPAHSFEWDVGGYTQESLGAWSACDRCSACVEDNRWDELLQRTINAYPPFLRDDRDVIHLARTIHQRFRDARFQGEPGARQLWTGSQ
jgi:hypothetical protein